MEDRLAELRSASSTPATAKPKESAEMMPAFNKTTNKIQYYLNKVKENSAEIASLKARHIKATLTDQEKEISEKLNHLIGENTKYCQLTKTELETIEAEVKKAKEEEPDEPETRIKDVTYRALKGKFAEILKDSQNTQIEYKTAVKAKIVRQAKIIDPTLTQEQVEAVCSDPDGASNLLASKMLGPGHVKLQHAVADIKDKYKDILRLERSVEMVHQMFVDMQMLVQAQGEMLDNIELNIQDAKDYMQKGVKQLDNAKKSHKIYKKYRCCLLIVLLVILVLVVVVPVATKA